jgi:4-amino-4-deoxy-L-arabinose transferase-like glycosyltransferase
MTSLIKPSRLLWIVLALAVTLRLLVLVIALEHPERTLAPDSDGYIQPAVVLVTEGGYNDPSAIRTPGYPLFLAAVFVVFGQSLAAVVAVQLLLNLLTLFFLFKIGQLLLPQDETWLSVILFALALEAIFTAFFILTETLFAFLLAATTWALVKYRASPGWGWAALAGAVTGYAVLTRPIAMLYPLATALVLLFSKSAWRTRLAHLTLNLALTAALVAPWILRNYNTLGVASLSTISGRYSLYYQAAFLVADQQNLPIEQVKQDLRAQVDAIVQRENLPNDEVSRARVETELARQIVLADPLRYAAVHLREDVKGLLPGVSILLNVFGVQEDREHPLTVLKYQGAQAALENYFGDQTWLIALFIPYFLFLGAVYLGGTLGAFALARRKLWFELFILLLPIVYYLGLPGGSSNARFRVPVMPYLCLLAGVGLVSAWRGLSARRSRVPSASQAETVEVKP